MWNPLPIYEWQQDCEKFEACRRSGVFYVRGMGRFNHEVEECLDRLHL